MNLFDEFVVVDRQPPLLVSATKITLSLGPRTDPGILKWGRRPCASTKVGSDRRNLMGSLDKQKVAFSFVNK